MMIRRHVQRQPQVARRRPAERTVPAPRTQRRRDGRQERFGGFAQSGNWWPSELGSPASSGSRTTWLMPGFRLPGGSAQAFGRCLCLTTPAICRSTASAAADSGMSSIVLNYLNGPDEPAGHSITPEIYPGSALAVASTRGSGLLAGTARGLRPAQSRCFAPGRRRPRSRGCRAHRGRL